LGRFAVIYSALTAAIVSHSVDQCDGSIHGANHSMRELTEGNADALFFSPDHTASPGVFALDVKIKLIWNSEWTCHI
jgi:hypothetical protein